MKSNFSTRIAAITLFAALTIPVGLAAQDTATQAKTPTHHHYKLIVLGTLGGPQSYGDPGHGAANINNLGIAVGVADTNTPDPNYPNYNPLGFFSDPFVHHAFQWRDGAIIDLGALPGDNSSSASRITDNGLVSGQSLTGSIDPLTGYPAQNGVLWKDGQIINLGTLGGYESGAGVVNSRGQVTGFSGNAIPDPFSFLGLGTQTRAFLWDEKNGMQDIGTLGGPDAFAPWINERGQIAGLSYTNSTPNPTTGLPTTDPFLWENGKMIDLGTLGGTFGGAGGLNNRGQVFGGSNLAGDAITRGFLWTPPGPMRDLGTLGGPNATANAINESGEVIGYADTANYTDAFLWRNGVMTDLGVLPGDCFSGAFGINAESQITGQSFSCDFSVARAFLWENGQIIDLNVFVPHGYGITLVDIETINDLGEMFGAGVLTNGDSRAFLLIPCDENHPNVEGCDYSMVEMAEQAAHPAPRANTLSAALAWRNRRFRFSALGRKN